MKNTERIELRSKTLFYPHWERGFFGNRPMTWDTPEEVVASGYHGKITVRYRGLGVTKAFYPGLDVVEASEVLCRLVAEGYALNDLYLHEDVPIDAQLVNGEICWVGPILNLVYSTVQKRMRESLAEGKVAVSGLNARLVLCRYLEPEDREHLYGLLDQYPNHAIEFTGYSRRLGTLNRKMIIWEVRLY